MRGKIVGKLRQQIDKEYFSYLPTGIIERIRKECSEICNRNHKFKEYGSALMKYLDTFQKRQEYVTKYQFSKDTEHQRKSWTDSENRTAIQNSSRFSKVILDSIPLKIDGKDSGRNIGIG